MSYGSSLAASSKFSPRYSGSNTANPMYRMRALSTSTTTSACSDDTSASSSSATTASECYYSRRTAAPTRYSSPESDIALVSNLSHKSGTKHVLIRARNANIPILLRHHQKKTNILTVRRREAQDDPDYELPQLQGLQRVKKQKTKTPEQLEAEERRMLERKAELEDDPLLDASRMCPNKVWCIPCNKYIQIDSRRQFYATLWYKHRGKRHGDVPLKRSELSEQMDFDMDLESNDTTSMRTKAIESPVALAVPLIDDAFASSILAEMYSKAQGLRLLSLAAAALG